MNPGRTLIIFGVILIALGLLVTFSGKLPFRIGRLPGDIVIEGKGGSFYFPIVTCILISVVLTLLGWLTLLKGAVRIVAPKLVADRARLYGRNTNIIMATAIVLLVLGGVLSYFGYVPAA